MSSMESPSADSSEQESQSLTVCHLCRQRKTKCDRRLPRCGFCIKAKVQCQYVAKPKKRGLRAGYVTELESRIEHLEQTLEELKRNDASTVLAESLVDAAVPVTTPVPLLSTSNAATPVPSAQTTNTPGNLSTRAFDSHEAVNDLMNLPREFFYSTADQWIKTYSSWMPFLTRDELHIALEALPVPVDRIDDLVLKAVMALEIAYSTPAICLGYKGRQRLSSYLKAQVLVEAIGNPSINSLQALLIIALLDYGSDDIASTHSIMAINRRMAENIGLFRQLLKRIEGESPTQVGPPARDHCGDELAIAVTWCILALDAVSSLGVPWRDVSGALIDHLSSVAFISTTDFRDSFRTHTHLAAIGLQPVHEFLHSFYRHGEAPGAVPAEVCNEMYHNLMSYARGLPETSYTLLADGAVDFDPCQIFTCILVHAAIIMIYQRYTFHPNEDIYILARSRCAESCAAVVNVIRNVSDTDAETTSPILATMIFVAARLELVLSRWLTRDRGPGFDTLMHGLNMCGRRWPLARRYDIVLRAAMIDVESGNPSSLPEVFWDLTKTHLEICRTMKLWVHEMRTSLYVGSLNGPYV